MEVTNPDGGELDEKGVAPSDKILSSPDRNPPSKRKESDKEPTNMRRLDEPMMNDGSGAPTVQDADIEVDLLGSLSIDERSIIARSLLGVDIMEVYSL